MPSSPVLIPEGVTPTTPYTLQEDYTSTAVGKGASLIAISDPGDCFDATDVEGALQELCSSMGSAEAANVSIIDEGGYYESSNVEGALQEVGASLSFLTEALTDLPAVNVSLTDEGDYYDSTDVEGALQELGGSAGTTYRASAALNFNSTSSSSSSDLTITVTGASTGDVVALGVPAASVISNTCYTAWVSATNTVTVRFNNYSNASQNPSSGTFTVIVTSVGGGGGGG